MAEVAVTKQVSIDDLVAQSERAFEILMQVRGLMLSPDSEKKAPTFSAAAVATMCGLDKHQLHYRLSKADLPGGRLGKGNRREFSLADTRAWVTAYRGGPPRPAGRKAITIAVANFKGGVSKTTTAMTLSQGLSLRGYKVLVVDLDPQGSLTTLFGVLPDVEVNDDRTVLPLLAGDQKSARYAIHESYWDGVDFIPANSQLFNAELLLPSYQSDRSRVGGGEPFEFWNVLNRGLDDVRDDYDVIIIDTAPALSYLTINALMAAEGLIVPLPPSALDFASSVQFWSLFSDISKGLRDKGKFRKSYEFVRVLLARVDQSDAATVGVQRWITAAYADKVFPVEIPKTAVALASSATDFGTVYDVVRYEGSAKTYQRARAAYDRVAELLDQILVQCWLRQGEELREAA